jgi:hypothetical protein
MGMGDSPHDSSTPVGGGPRRIVHSFSSSGPGDSSFASFNGVGALGGGLGSVVGSIVAQQHQQASSPRGAVQQTAGSPRGVVAGTSPVVALSSSQLSAGFSSSMM